MLDLSAGWPSVPLGKTLSRIDAGNSPDLPDRPAESGDWGVLKVSAVKPDGIHSNENKVVSRPDLIDPNLEVRPGDVIITRANTPDLIGLACFVRQVQPQLMLSDKTLRLVVDRNVADPRFVAHALAAPSARRQISRAGTGSSGSMKNISQRDIRSLLIPHPPLSAQRRVSEILDSVDEAIRSTERLVRKAEDVMGAAVRRTLEIALAASGSSAISTVEREFDLKAGITLGPHRVPRRRPTPYLRVANVQRGHLRLDDIAMLEASECDISMYSLRPGDLLIVEGHANPQEIGRCAIVRSAISPLLFQNHLFRLRPRRLEREYCHLWLNSDFARSYWHRVCATSSGLYTINAKQLRSLSVFAPELSEQRKIVAVAKAHEKRLASERKQLGKLRCLKQGLIEDLLTGRIRLRTGEA
jgi:type I restriction enzyme, S subunit